MNSDRTIVDVHTHIGSCRVFDLNDSEQDPNMDSNQIDVSLGL